jgi:hypothetical protein
LIDRKWLGKKSIAENGLELKSARKSEVQGV